MRLNLNETVKFKLTERGKELYREHFSHLPDCFEQPEPRIDEDGFTEMQLWMFMEIFGEHMSVWKPNVIEPLEIVFDTEDSEACKEQKSKLDCISRQQAINAVENTDINITESEWDELINAIDNLPPVTPTERTGEWIPVSERLPEDTGHEYADGLTQSELVLAYAVHGDTKGYGIGWYIRDHYTPADSGWSGAFEDIYELSDCEVIAWQPLPEPYKGGDTE